MAQLIPQTEIDSIENEPEQETARSLVEQLPDESIVFHSYPWLRKTNKSNSSYFLSEGETDFVVVLPDQGFLVLEVKGGEIRYSPRSGKWTRKVSYGNKPIQDPFKQASRNMHKLKDDIAERSFPSAKHLPFAFGYSVVFPNCEYGGTPPPGADHATILSSKDLGFLDRRIPEALNAWSRGQSPNDADLKGLIEALTSSFHLVPLLSKQFAYEHERFVRLTADQMRILDVLERQKRCLIEGVAGSGKTMLAVERARRFARDGKRVLVVCYNLALANWLSDLLDDEYEDCIDVFSYHGLCEHFCELALIDFKPGEDRKKFFNETAPMKLLEASSMVDKRYDAIVVDEGQDFRYDWWATLEELCSNGIESPFYVFFDSDQNLFVDELQLPDFGEPFQLKNNCRNTKEVARLCSKILGVELQVRPESPEGSEVRAYLCPDEQSHLKKTIEIVKDLKSKRLNVDQIAIVSPYTRKNSLLRDAKTLAGIDIVDSIDEWKAGKGILFATIKAIKGLEADAVIVVDVPNVDDHKYFTEKDLYVGFSRAKHFLAILTKEKTDLTYEKD